MPPKPAPARLRRPPPRRRERRQAAAGATASTTTIRWRLLSRQRFVLDVLRDRGVGAACPHVLGRPRPCVVQVRSMPRNGETRLPRPSVPCTWQTNCKPVPSGVNACGQVRAVAFRACPALAYASECAPDGCPPLFGGIGHHRPPGTLRNASEVEPCPRGARELVIGRTSGRRCRSCRPV